MILFNHYQSSQKQNRSFSQFLITILISILVLTTFVFILIYTNVNTNSREHAFTNEQENIGNISYSFFIMDDNAFSFLSQIYNDTEIQQLIYVMQFDNVTSAKTIVRFKEYVSAFQWIDSAYIYNQKEASVACAYLKNDTSYGVSCLSVDNFWDQEFLEQLCDMEIKEPVPTMRNISYASGEKERTVLTYYLPVQNRVDSYDGLYVINIKADRLMELSHGIVNDQDRQIIVADTSENYYSNDTILLAEDAQQKLLQNIRQSGKSTGKCTVEGLVGEVFCTWNYPRNSRFVFISCVPMSSILSIPQQIRIYLVLFYCAVLFISLCALVLFSHRANKEYTALRNQYTQAIKQYQDNHSYIKDTLLRNFLTTKGDYHIVTERFLENNIALPNYKYYSLVLMEIKTSSSQSILKEDTFKNPRIALQNILSREISNQFRFEVVDILQNRHLLIIEHAESSAFKKLLENCSSALLEKYAYSISGLFAANVGSLNDIPASYMQLADYLDMLYFYTSDCFADISALRERDIFGYNHVNEMTENLKKELKEQHFEQANEVLSAFFEQWFEPLNDVPRTLEYFVRELSGYINTFAHTYAVTVDFDSAAFLRTVNQCEYARNVKTQFLNLLDDIQSVFAGIGQRSNIIDQVVDLIRSNYHDPSLCVETLACDVGLSASHMQSVFKATTGISVSRYLRHYRLQKSAELLVDTDISINLIAEQTGFGNASYFYTVFKKHYSITPNEYRLQHKVSQTTGDSE